MFSSGELTSEELHGPESLSELQDENDAVLRGSTRPAEPLSR
jgi:hypothetical protein